MLYGIRSWSAWVRLPQRPVNSVAAVVDITGTAVSFAIQALVMLWLLDRRLGGLELRRSGVRIGKMLVAAIVTLPLTFP